MGLPLSEKVTLPVAGAAGVLLTVAVRVMLLEKVESVLLEVRRVEVGDCVMVSTRMPEVLGRAWPSPPK